MGESKFEWLDLVRAVVLQLIPEIREISGYCAGGKIKGAALLFNIHYSSNYSSFSGVRSQSGKKSVINIFMHALSL